MRSRSLLTGRGRYPTGSQPPPGYLQWHSWADDQARAGLKQRTCSMCGKYRFPQEFANEMACNECFKAKPHKAKEGVE